MTPHPLKGNMWIVDSPIALHLGAVLGMAECLFIGLCFLVVVGYNLTGGAVGADLKRIIRIKDFFFATFFISLLIARYLFISKDEWGTFDGHFCICLATQNSLWLSCSRGETQRKTPWSSWTRKPEQNQEQYQQQEQHQRQQELQQQQQQNWKRRKGGEARSLDNARILIASLSTLLLCPVDIEAIKILALETTFPLDLKISVSKFWCETTTIRVAATKNWSKSSIVNGGREINLDRQTIKILYEGQSKETSQECETALTSQY